MTETTLSAVTKMRLLDEMLGSIKVEGQWSVLIMDDITTQIMSNVCGVSDLLDYGVSLVDNVAVPRQPQPHLTGIYFISPTPANVRAIVTDFNRKGQSQYRNVHIFFSSAVDPSIIQTIQGCPKLLERLSSLKEVNLEFILYPDNRSFTTAQDFALPGFFNAAADTTDEYRTEIHKMATRLATVFSTMKEFPSIRFRAALPPGDEYPPGLESRLLISQRLAVELYEILAEMQKSGQVPERETCELIITDRGFDPVAPVIHEWTYEAMTHDLLEGSPMLKGKVFNYDSESRGGKKEHKEHVLDERDVMHVDLRHQHFAAASLRISAAMDELRAQSRLAGKGKSVGDLDLKGMSKLVQALPEYRDQLATVGAHVELASALNRAVESRRLLELGKLEQDLVYGDATSKEVISLLSANQMLPESDKIRVLMCYSATHQEKLDPTRATQWQKVARLTPGSMASITNLEYLGVPVCKRQKGGVLDTLTFGRRRRRAVRKDREPEEDEGQYALSRFVPLLAEILEDASTGRLPQEEYPFVRPPTSPSYSGGFGASGGPSFSNDSNNDSDGTPRAGGATSFRTLRSTGTWAKKAGSGPVAAPSAAEARMAEVGGGSRGSRVIAFVIGGFTFSELRVAHRFTARTGRDVILGGTNVQTPAQFVKQIVALGEEPETAKGAFEIEQPAGGVSVRRK